MATKPRSGKKPWADVPTTETTKRERIPVEPPPDEEERDPTEEQAQDDVEDVLASLPQEARVELARWSDQVQDWTYAGRHPAQGFTLDWVARKFGAGKFRMVIRGPIDGKMRLRAKRVFHIDPSIVPHPEAAPSGETGLSTADMLKLNMQLITTLVSNRPEDKTAELVTALAALMKPAAAPFSIQDMLLLLKAGERPATSTDEILKVLNLGIKIAEGREPEDGLGMFAKAASGLVEKLSAQPQPRPPALPPAPPPPPAPPKLPPLPPASSSVDPVRDYFGSLVPMFAKAAEGDADVGLYAALLVDQIPQELDAAVEQWINLDDYPEPLVPYFPPEIDRDWLRRVLLEARILLTSEDNDDDADTPTAGGHGDEADASGHGPARPGGAN